MGIDMVTLDIVTKKFTSKISKSVGVMRRRHCQLPADVIVKPFGVFPSDLCVTGIYREDRDVL